MTLIGCWLSGVVGPPVCGVRERSDGGGVWRPLLLPLRMGDPVPDA